MQVHIFRGTGRVFGVTEHPAGANLPPQYGRWSVFKTLDLKRDGEPTPGLDTRECLDDIEKYGFHITDCTRPHHRKHSLMPAGSGRGRMRPPDPKRSSYKSASAVVQTEALPIHGRTVSLRKASALWHCKSVFFAT
jgi:hypothetical protein